MKELRLKSRATSFVLNAVFMVFTLSCIFPVIWVFYSSMKTEAEFANNIASLPRRLNLDNYIAVLKATNMPLFLFNSFRNTVISVALILLISFTTGYVLSRLRFCGRDTIYSYYIFGLLIPIHALLVPVYLQFKAFHLDDHWYTLLIPYVAYGLPFPIFLVVSYIRTIPMEMEEAAMIDGCSFMKTLFLIILPMASPVLATVAILSFFGCWNEYPFALMLTGGESLRTVSLGLTQFQANQTTNYPMLMAAMMIALLPVAVIYFCFSSKIIKGVAAGAVKG